MTRNVFLLSCTMALGMSGAPVIVFLGGIIGSELAPYPSWSTVPVAMLVLGTAVTTVPAALLMERVGRRAGFMIASFFASLACLAGIYALDINSFFLFCLVSLFIGANMAFVQQYRFAAAESVHPERVSKAVSLVFLGGVAAAYLGPELAEQSREILPFGLYSGSFGVLAALYLVNTCLLSFLAEPPVRRGVVHGEMRDLREIILQPVFLTAVMAGLVSYAVMAFIMTATPVSMHVIDDFSINQTAWVIQSHIMAMFIPSLFTGFLIARYGLVRIMLAGTGLMTGCAVIAMVEHHFVHYWTGLVLLGIGWNFLFIGGTTLLTRCYRPGERFKAQAVNDLSVFGFQAMASLSAGTVLFKAGWRTLNAISIPLLIATFLVILILKKQIESPAVNSD